MVGQEHDPAAGQHGARDLAGQASQDAGKFPGLAVPDPEPSRGAAPVALPVRRLVLRAGQQHRDRAVSRDVSRRAELQPTWRPARDRDGMGPGQEPGGLTGRADREDLPVVAPAGDPGPAVAPVGEPPVAAAVDPGHVDLAGVVAGRGPGDRARVRGQPRVADRGAFRGQAPRAAAVGRREPYVVIGDERQQIALDMWIAQITGSSHRLIVRPCGSRPAPLARRPLGSRLAPLAPCLPGLLAAGRFRASRVPRRSGGPRCGYGRRSSGCRRTGNSGRCPRTGRAGGRSR